LYSSGTQGIYFAEMNSSFVAPVLKFYRFATGQIEIVKEFSKDTRLDLFETTLSVSPDDQWIIYTQAEHLGSDLMLMENYR
jgi:hypothetical protein